MAKNFKQTQGFIQAMKKKREESKKIKDHYESDKGKQELGAVRRAYDKAVSDQVKILPNMPF